MYLSSLVEGGGKGGRASNAAFTLAEVLIAVGVLGVASVSLLAGFTAGFSTIEMARENQRATQILIEKAETIRLYSWDQVNAGMVPTNFTDRYDPQAPVGQQGPLYIGTISISAAPVSASYSNELKAVTVQLQWETAGIARTRSYRTYISSYGLQNYMF